MSTPEATIWQMRYLIYQGFASTGAPPALEQLAADLGVPEGEALRELGDRHSVVTTDDQQGVLMANPFSAVPTPFRVTANGIDYWANCAWDMLGVPAALGADAMIHATWAVDNDPAELRVTNGTVSGSGGIVHFLKPFSQLVRRHPAHLKHHPALPVGRRAPHLVYDERPSDRSVAVTRRRLEPLHGVVPRPPRPRFPHTHPRRSSRDLRADGTDGSVLVDR